MSYDISVKNTLLDEKHFKAMGKSVWLYMLLLDKVTRVEADGTGIVLGGKPLTYEEYISPVFPITRQTYYKWVEQLEDYPYVETLRTPHGIVFRVIKAHKFFGQRDVNKTLHHSKSDVNKSLHRCKQNLTSDVNKTLHVYIDNTVDNTKTIQGEPAKLGAGYAKAKEIADQIRQRA